MANDKNEKLDPEIKAVKEDMDALRKDVASLTEHLKSLAQAGGTEAKRGAEKELERIRGEVDRMAQSLGERGRQSVGQLEREIEDRPLVSLLMAFGVGLLIGKILDRR